MNPINDNPIIKNFDPTRVYNGVHYGTSFEFMFNGIKYDLDIYGKLTTFGGGFIVVNDVNYSVNSDNGKDFKLTNTK
jgi:hypothetical protein